MIKNHTLQTICIVLIALSWSGCAYLSAAKALAGNTNNNGTTVSGNRLHAGPKTAVIGKKEYKDIKSVNYTYKHQTGDHFVTIFAIISTFALFGFIVYRFFRFLRRLVEKKFL